MAIDGATLTREIHSSSHRSEKATEKANSQTTKSRKGVKRTPHEKVRSGCKTCKKRRVKCDERLPTCLRCEKFGIKCDGYISKTPQPVIEPSKNETRIILPRKRGALDESPVSPGLVEVKKVRFGNEDEMRYFRLFCEKTSLHLSGYYDPAVWGKIVLQASEADDSIRHAVISIGALDMTVLMMRDFENQEAREHHVFALKQYSKAIRNMRAMVLRQNEMQDLHTALVASILIICFETYHGNYASVAQQIRTGVRLIEEFKAKGNGVGVDEDLLRAFDRLDVQSMSHSDPFTLEEHIALRNVYTHTPKDIPAVFTDLKTCRDHFNYISRRSCHFASMVWKLEHSNEKDKNTHRPQAFSSTTRTDWSDMDWETAIHEELTNLVLLTDAWMASFTPLYNQARAAMQIPFTDKPLCKTVIGALAMRNHYLCMRLAFRHFKVVNETIWDKALPEFTEILENAEVICANREPLAFSFDLQSVWPLDILAKKCRDSRMRRRAIQLLKEKPRREGIWDSIVAAMVCEWIVNVEEEGMLEDGFIPESARARNICVELNAEDRKAKVWCFLPVPSSFTNDKYKATRKKEVHLEWGSSKWNRGFKNNSNWIQDLQPKAALPSDTNTSKPAAANLYMGFNARKSGIGDSAGNEIFSRIYSNTQVSNFQAEARRKERVGVQGDRG